MAESRVVADEKSRFVEKGSEFREAGKEGSAFPGVSLFGGDGKNGVVSLFFEPRGEDEVVFARPIFFGVAACRVDGDAPFVAAVEEPWGRLHPIFLCTRAKKSLDRSAGVFDHCFVGIAHKIEMRAQGKVFSKMVAPIKAIDGKGECSDRFGLGAVIVLQKKGVERAEERFDLEGKGLRSC